jgi:hypothetical protein
MRTILQNRGRVKSYSEFLLLLEKKSKAEEIALLSFLSRCEWALLPLLPLRPHANTAGSECVSFRQDSYDSKHQLTKQTSFALINSTSSSDEPSSVSMILAFKILSRMLGGSSVATKLATELKVEDAVIVIVIHDDARCE